MSTQPNLDEQKTRAAGHPAPENIVHLYQEAFTRFGPAYLWSWRALPHPTLSQVVTIAAALRREGNLPARAFTEQMEKAIVALYR